MATSPHHSELDTQRLIEKHIDLDFDRYPFGRADAWLRRSGVSIWVILMHLKMYDGDRDRVADEYGLSSEELDAALAYYERYKKYIDARILLNEA